MQYTITHNTLDAGGKFLAVSLYICNSCTFYTKREIGRPSTTFNWFPSLKRIEVYSNYFFFILLVYCRNLKLNANVQSFIFFTFEGNLILLNSLYYNAYRMFSSIWGERNSDWVFKGQTKEARFNLPSFYCTIVTCALGTMTCPNNMYAY